MTNFGVGRLESNLAKLYLTVPLPMDCAIDSTNPLDVCRSLLAEILSGLIESSPEAAYESIHWPNNIYNGDLAIVLPKLRPGCKAAEIALEIGQKFPQEHPLFLLPFLDGVHFRIFLQVDAFARFVFPLILRCGHSYGNDPKHGLRNSSFLGEGRRKLVVEFSSPNITSELHGRYLRSTVLGAFVSSFYETMGWEVVRLNYLGDWGKNLALLKVGWDRFADEAIYQSRPIEHILEIYDRINSLFQPEVTASRHARDEAAKDDQDEGQAQAKIENQGIYAARNAAFKKLEEGDKEAIAFWKQIRDVNIENYNDFYSKLGIKFDEYSGESQISADTMVEVETLLKEKNICEESYGAWVVHMQNHGLRAGTAVIRGRDGATTYLLRDLAAMIERSRRYKFDKMIIVAANDHNSLHFTHLHYILIAMGMKDLAKKIQHLKFNETSNMAATVGTGFKPQAILSHIERAMSAKLRTEVGKTAILGNLEKSVDKLSIASLLVHELSTRTSSTHSFDLSAMTTFKHGTGLYLQYWYAKLCIILQTRNDDVQNSEVDYHFLTEDDSAANLLRLLSQFPEVTRATYNCISPQPDDIVRYLADVTEQLSECLSNGHDENNGLEGEAEAKAEGKAFEAGHLTLFEATRIVLENGLKLLGITPYVAEDRERADTPTTE